MIFKQTNISSFIPIFLLEKISYCSTMNLQMLLKKNTQNCHFVFAFSIKTRTIKNFDSCLDKINVQPFPALLTQSSNDEKYSFISKFVSKKLNKFFNELSSTPVYVGVRDAHFLISILFLWTVVYSTNEFECPFGASLSSLFYRKKKVSSLKCFEIVITVIEWYRGHV